MSPRDSHALESRTSIRERAPERAPAQVVPLLKTVTEQTSAPDPGQLRRFFAAEIDGVDAELGRVLDSLELVPSHSEMIRYHLGLGLPPAARGKRLRPIIALLMGRSAGARPEAIQKLMVAIELAHSASLVHDDIQDREQTRWGRPTAWARYGQDQAINIGDAMLALVYQTLSTLWEAGVTSSAALRVIKQFSETQARMTEGQHLDLFFEGQPTVSIDDYWKMIAGKTAAVCECVTACSAIIAHADDLEPSFREFGHAFGMLYQVVDDYCDIWASGAETGKTVQSDLQRGKSTLPLILSYRYGDDAFRARLRAGDLPSDYVLDRFDSLRIRERCREFAVQYRDRALNALDCIRDANPEHQLLTAMTRLCAARADAG